MEINAKVRTSSRDIFSDKFVPENLEKVTIVWGKVQVGAEIFSLYLVWSVPELPGTLRIHTDSPYPLRI